MIKVKSSLLILICFCMGQIAIAQNDTMVYDFKDFDKVQIENVQGEVDIEIGNSFAITISGTNNAPAQVQISKQADKLLVKLDSKFVTDWKSRKVVKIKIILPQMVELFNYSNADVGIKNLVGKNLLLEKKGNGNITVAGTTVDQLEINNNGNGNLETKNINSKNVSISKSGNGDVSIFTNNQFNVAMAGNGDVVNFGKGKATIKKQSGTGKVLYRN